MSGLLAGKVWQSALPKWLKPLAAALADIANDDGTRIYPSVAYVAWLLGGSERAVQDGLLALRKMQVLEVVSGLTVSGHPKGGRMRTVQYRLREENLPKRAPWRDSQKGATSAPFPSNAGGSRTGKGATASGKRCNFQQEKVRPAAPEPLENRYETKTNIKPAETRGGFPQPIREAEHKRKITAKNQRLAMEAKGVPRTGDDRKRQAYNAGVDRDREDKNHIDEHIAAARRSGARTIPELAAAVGALAAKKAMS